MIPPITIHGRPLPVRWGGSRSGARRRHTPTTNECGDDDRHDDGDADQNPAKRGLLAAGKAVKAERTGTRQQRRGQECSLLAVDIVVRVGVGGFSGS